MNIAFIRTNMFAKQAGDAMAPLIFAIIKGLTPADVSIRFYDENVEKIPERIAADVAALTVDTFNARRAYQLAAAFRARGVKVVMGGFHPTILPDECMNHADAVVIGEAEDTWPRIIQDLKNGTLQDKYVSSNDTDLSGVVYDDSAYMGKKYNKIGLVQFSRGCRYACDFCSIHAFYRDNVRTRAPQKIVEDIKKRNEKYLFFIDDNFFVDEQKARELVNALIPLNKQWVCQISIDAAKDTELLKLMKQSGCIAVIIGFESLDRDNLKTMKKAANLRNFDYDRIIANLYDCHLMIYGTFVIGYDADTKNTAREMAGFAAKNKFMISNFNPLMPMPGTKLYDRLDGENRLLHKRWWLDDSYRYGDAMLKPGRMGAEELREGCEQARYAFYSWKNILTRSFHRKSNAFSWTNRQIFWAANLISAREIHAKQGRRLGEPG